MNLGDDEVDGEEETGAGRKESRRSESPPLRVGRGTDAWTRFHKRTRRGKGALDNTLVTSNAGTSRRVYRVLEESRGSEPFDLMDR